MSLESGEIGIVVPTLDGHYSFVQAQTPISGQKAFIYPSNVDRFYLFKLLENPYPGQQGMIIPDNKGIYYLIDLEGGE